MEGYRIISVERTDSPEADENPWFRYVIANDVTVIEGIRSGTREEVFDHASQCAERLNTRHKSPARW